MKSLFRAKHLLLCLSSLLLFSGASVAHDGESHDGGKNDASAPPAGGGSIDYPSMNVTLLSNVPLTALGGGTPGVLGNDIWGWTDPLTNREYAIFGRSDGTSFLDITNPTAPVYLGNLQGNGGNEAWRDMKVYNNHAFIVADGASNATHGMQVFDLTRLRTVDVSGGPANFTVDALYTGFGNAHNIAINEATGFAYAIGSNTFAGGLHVVNLQNPLAPTLAGGFAGDGYTHDTQSVVYRGPDPTYIGREITFNSNEDTLTIVDVSNKSAMAMISRNPYPQAAYSHQGWLSDDHRYFFMDDELDEATFNVNTRTHVWDVLDLDSPAYLGFYQHDTPSIDHNLYYKDGLLYEANYTTGLRVLDVSLMTPGAPNLNIQTVAWIDTLPQNDSRSFDGAWSVYPFFPSGNVIVSDRQNGLFVVRVNATAAGAVAAPEPGTLALSAFGLAALGALRLRKRRRCS